MVTLINQRQKKQSFNKRLVICGFAMGAALMILLLRVVFLQIIESDHYNTLATQNRLNLVPIAPARGLIYDRNGVLLADNIPIFNLVIVPEKTSDLTTTIEKLSKIISINDDNKKLFTQSLQTRRRFQAVTLRYKLDEEEVARFSVERHRFPGVSIEGDLMRFYPHGKEMVTLLGYMGQLNAKELKHIDTSNYAATAMIGKEGIEKHYENLLHGTVGYQEIEVDASGHTLRTIKRFEPIAGANLTLTIDSGLQQALLAAFKRGRGAAIALDPNNGEILAFVSSPSFDPNPLVQGISTNAYHSLQRDPDRPLYNRALKGYYPIGSPIKPFIALEGLRSHTITPSFTIQDMGFYQVPHTHHRFRDWTLAGHGVVNLSKAITVSCDTYFYQLAYQLGIQKIIQIMREFGFGQRTQADLPNEPTGLLPTPKWKRKTKGEPWYTGDTIVAGIGQGYWLTTPLQIANATATLAMRGERYIPHLLHHFNLAMEPVTTIKPHKLKPVVIKPQFWSPVITAMQRVITSPMGTGRRHFGQDAPYSIAAKTGTVQHFKIKANEQYHAESTPERLKDDSTFIAFAPVNKPQIALFVVAENNAEAAPRIARQALDYYFLHHKKST